VGGVQIIPHVMNPRQGELELVGNMVLTVRRSSGRKTCRSFSPITILRSRMVNKVSHLSCKTS